MRRILEQLKNQQYRSSTRKNYYTIWKQFNKFFVKLDIRPDSLEDRLSLYAAYLVHESQKSTTIRCYVSAIRAILREVKIEFNEDRVPFVSNHKGLQIDQRQNFKPPAYKETCS